ncbi:uncharacterized protein 7-like [Haliotis rufescens]|uniref:uncharacterized protein 7-like n=1 Tax=Haliotis rufescens TaxID=6454 RepID=UPI001EB07DC0|nr:uncharacterized protein 7-like [Haliotis rufescens]
MKCLVGYLCLTLICLTAVENKKVKCHLFMLKRSLVHYVSRDSTGVHIMPCPPGTIFSEGHCGCVTLTNGCDMKPYSGRKYKHFIHGRWRTRYCPSGTTLNQSKCVCDHA